MNHLVLALGSVGLAVVGYQLSANAQSAQQIATFGGLRYSPPIGFSSQASKDFVEFTSIDNQRKTFLKLAVYATTPSSGDLAADSQTDWKMIAVKMFGAPATPSSSQNATLAGSPAVFLTGTFPFEQRTVTVTTFTARAGSRKATVLAMSTDINFYLPAVRTFLAGISMSDEASTPPAAVPIITKAPVAPLAGAPRAVAELYNLSLPKHFTQQKTDAALIVTDTSTNTQLTFLPVATGTGNLAVDAKNVLAVGFSGWQPSTGWQQNSTRVISSTTSAGVPYVVVHQDLEQGARKIIASALVFGVGNNQIAPVIGQCDHIISAINWNGYQATLSAFTLAAHAVDFKHLKSQPSGIKLENSTWESITSSAGLVLTFHPKGSFSTGAATRTAVSHSDTHDKVTSTSWANDGSWTLKGNLLTMVYRASKVKSQSLLRLAVEESDGRRDEFLGMFDLQTSGEMRLSKSK